MLADMLDQVHNQWHHIMVVGATNRADIIPILLGRRFDMLNES
jgi:aspartate ammonia-lyase